MKISLEFHKLPFKPANRDTLSDGISFDFIFDVNSFYSFLFIPNMNEAKCNKVLDSINSENYKPLVYSIPVKFEYSKERKTILLNDLAYIIIRGYKELSEKFGEEKAKELQDNLGEYIISKIT